MITYVGRQSPAAAAIVIPDEGIDQMTLVREVKDAIRHARLVGWLLSDVPDIDPIDLARINKLASTENSLVVAVDPQPAVERRLLHLKFSNIILGRK